MKNELTKGSEPLIEERTQIIVGKTCKYLEILVADTTKKA